MGVHPRLALLARRRRDLVRPAGRRLSGRRPPGRLPGRPPRPDRPAESAAMYGERPSYASAVVVALAHRPDAGGRGSTDAVEQVADRTRIRAWPPPPGGRVPALDKAQLHASAVLVVAHRPGVGGGDGGHAIESVE